MGDMANLPKIPEHLGMSEFPVSGLDGGAGADCDNIGGIRNKEIKWPEPSTPTFHSHNMWTLLSQGIRCDALLIIGSGKLAIGVHKFVLRAQSPFFNDWFESKAASGIILKNVDFRNLKPLLVKMYVGGSGGLTRMILLRLLKLSMDLFVPSVVEECHVQLSHDLDYWDQKMFQIMEEATTYLLRCYDTKPKQPWALVRAYDFKASVLEYICKNAWRLVDMEGFVVLGDYALMDILGQDDLQVKNEVQLYDALLRWGDEDLRRRGLDPLQPAFLRAVLGPALKLIRFPRMDGIEFLRKVALANILTAQEVNSVMYSFIANDENRDVIPPCLFKDKKRNYYVKPTPAERPLTSDPSPSDISTIRSSDLC